MALRMCIARAAPSLRTAPACAARRSFPTPQTRWQQLATRRQFSVSAAALEKKYTKDHEWVELSSDGKTCTLGISEYAAKALGDVVFVELPEIELEVGQGDSIGAVESVKSASDIMTPVSGIVTDRNKALEEKPAKLNQDPEGEAWIAKIEIKDEAELADLMDAKAYKEFTEE